jgi:predicted XRE-type DNA-binding protein
MEIQTQEARIVLAIEAIRTTKKLSQRSAAKLYKVPLSTLSDRMAGRTPRPETKANRQKLSKLEEEVIIRYILDLDSRGFAPRLASVEDIANLLLKSRGQDPIGTR